MIMELDIKREEIHNEDGTWLVKVTPAPWSGFDKIFEMKMTEDQHRRYVEWKKGRSLIQSVFPELSAADREGLISGIGPEDWAAMMAEPEEEEDDSF